MVSATFLILCLPSMWLQVDGASSCPTSSTSITLQDIRDAAAASNHIYYNIAEGAFIPKTRFKVIKLFHHVIASYGKNGIKVAIADNGNTRMVIYRGTEGFDQLFKQIKEALFVADQKTVKFGKYAAKVWGFPWNAFRLAYFQLRPYLAGDCGGAGRKYIFTGHSLGGVMASLLALEMTQQFNGNVWRNPRSCLITFGQPRVGDRSYADLHDRLLPTFRKIRIVLKADPATRFPLGSSWRHHSRAVYMGFRTKFESGFGKKREVYQALYPHMSSDEIEKRFLFKQRRFWQICNTQEDKGCTTRIESIIPNFQDHQIANYLKEVMNPPHGRFETRRGSKKSSFKAAFIGTCHKQ